ncbi:MAG TPA: alpha/beta hydrolase family protein [Acidimicrobiales bacterium]|nr:alpha/beta hydrolase family protein [Acidimicrobiales bacterium]
MSVRLRRVRLVGAVVAGSVCALLAAVSGPAHAAPPATAGCDQAQPTLRTITVPPPAGVHVVDDRVDVLVPPGYCASGRHYPVLYLLHGAGDTYRSWSANTDLVSFERAHAFPLIIVMPDGGHNATAGWYSDWLDGRYQYEAFDTGVLPRYVDSRYRTVRGDRGIAGLSMGGFGALSFAARHPGMYRVAASFSGAVDMLYGAPASGVIFDQLHDAYGTPNEDVWGSQAGNESVWAAHNPASLAAKLAGTALFLASGTGTPGGAQGDDPGNPGGYGLEHGVFQMNLSLVRALDRAGVPHTDDFYAGGYHGWPYWQADLHWALPQIASILGPSRP